MLVVYVRKTKEYYLVNGLGELDYKKLGIDYNREIYGVSFKKLNKYFVIRENMADKDGKLTYIQKEDRWVWDVYDKPKIARTQYINGIPVAIYNKVDVVKRISLINMMQN